MRPPGSGSITQDRDGRWIVRLPRCAGRRAFMADSREDARGETIPPGTLEALAGAVLADPRVVLARQVPEGGPLQVRRAVELAELLLDAPTEAGRRAAR